MTGVGGRRGRAGWEVGSVVDACVGGLAAGSVGVGLVDGWLGGSAGGCVVRGCVGGRWQWIGEWM